MTKEEKAKAYDKAIEKIKYVMEHGVSPVLNKEDLQDIFPELAESEDERVRKEFCKDIWTYIPNEKAHKYIVWLEKQREQKEYTFNPLPRLLDMIEPTSKAKAYCQKLIDILLLQGYSTDAKIVGEYLKQMNGEKVAMATMDEQKPADKVEPTVDGKSVNLEEYDRLHHLWKDAQGDDLPAIDREVVVLCECHSGYKVCYAHRPDPDGWDGVNILTEEIEHYGVKTYGKRGWSIPDVKWWLDLPLPYERKEDEK